MNNTKKRKYTETQLEYRNRKMMCPLCRTQILAREYKIHKKCKKHLKYQEMKEIIQSIIIK